MSQHQRSKRAERPAPNGRAWMWILVVLLGASVFAFGGVYSWGYWPLGAAAFIVGFALAGVGAQQKSGFHVKLVMAAMALTAVAVALELIPLTPSLLQRVTPATDQFLKQYDFEYLRSGAAAQHPLSIVPNDTVIALVLFGAFAVLLVGVSQIVSKRHLVTFVRGIAAVGLLVSLVGMVQNLFFIPQEPKYIYGFWLPEDQGDIFGPFVNHNHFAGWVLMALPLTITYLIRLVSRAMQRVDATWPARVRWFLSRDGSEAVFLALSAMTMTVALATTKSRSGLIGLLAIMIAIGGFAVTRLKGRWARVAIPSVLGLVVVLAVSRTGVDAFAKRFAESGGLSDRVHIWSDAWSVFRAFPLVGTGLNTYGTAMLLYQRFDLTQHYDAAHNDYAQLLAEGGYLVAVPAALTVLALAWSIWRARRNDRPDGTVYWIRQGAIIGLVAIAAQEICDFSLQIPANACLFAVVCGIALCRAGRHHEPERRLPVMVPHSTIPAAREKKHTMHRCPQCTSDLIHRSRSRTRWEAWRKVVTGKRLYRCHTCGWRGWTDDLGPPVTMDGATIPEPPNLQGSALARRGASDVDLTEIDQFGPTERDA